MRILYDLYGIHSEDTRYRSKLKARMQEAYPEKISYQNVDVNTAEVVINTDAMNSHTIVKDRKHLLKQAAECLREDILDHAQSIPNDLSSDERRPPESLG